MLKNIVALLSGIIFSLGLVVAQMVNPAKVLGFLDIAGDWDPSLALVMAAALLTLGLLQHFYIFKRTAPLYEERFHLPKNDVIDKRLLLGAAMFGLGWGIIGFCPGPALVALSLKPLPALLFINAMGLGIHLYGWYRRSTAPANP